MRNLQDISYLETNTINIRLERKRNLRRTESPLPYSVGRRSCTVARSKYSQKCCRVFPQSHAKEWYAWDKYPVHRPATTYITTIHTPSVQLIASPQIPQVLTHLSPIFYISKTNLNYFVIQKSQITTTWQQPFTVTCGLYESRKKTQVWPTTIIFHSPHFFILTASFPGA